MSHEQMACSITDGPQTPEEEAEWDNRWATIDEDAEYEELRQIEVDAGAVKQ